MQKFRNLRTVFYSQTYQSKNTQFGTVASAKSAYEAASKRYELGLAAYSDALQAKTAYAHWQTGGRFPSEAEHP